MPVVTYFQRISANFSSLFCFAIHSFGVSAPTFPIDINNIPCLEISNANTSIMRNQQSINRMLVSLHITQYYCALYPIGSLPGLSVYGCGRIQPTGGTKKANTIDPATYWQYFIPFA